MGVESQSLEYLFEVQHFAGVSLKQPLQCLGHFTLRQSFSTFLISHNRT